MSDEVSDPPGGGGENTSGTLRSPIGSRMVGTAKLDRRGPVEAGSWQAFTLTYTAGPYGIDDSGSLRVCFRYASDQSPPQFDDPAGPNYAEITASNSAVLQCRFDPKGNVRPWDSTIWIKIVKGYLLPGDTIDIRLGVRDHGGPGMRMQTFCEDSFEFRVLVDPLATFNFEPVRDQPTVAIVPGAPARYVATLPTRRVAGTPFRLHLKGEDRWGNPSDRCDVTFGVRSSMPVAGLPEQIALQPGSRAVTIDDLLVDAPGVLTIELVDGTGATMVRSNPLEIVERADLVPFWVDLHGQSEETIGTGSARAYFAFARDLAAVDATAHQGNDFQITDEFWAHLDRLTGEFEEPGRFLAIPGYEWSGNTGLGGDRNVFFPETGRRIRRSSRALVHDQSDPGSDAQTVGDLFAALARDKEWDVVCYAHCGGRYADLHVGHDGRFEKSVEVHSSWGTFEWIVQDAFDLGFRVGIVANSDGHKGRPGASYPGAGKFGAIGGLTCLLMPELTREALFDCLRKRRHYATTGGVTGRPLIDVAVASEEAATVYDDDPALGAAAGVSANTAEMGQIVHLPGGGARFTARIRSASPVERVDVFNGRDLVETVRPFRSEAGSRRIRIVWEGAEYRGRFRQVVWDGSLRVSGNVVERVAPINFFNPDKTLELIDGDTVTWQALTTGNIGGFDMWMRDAAAGSLHIDTPLVREVVEVGAIGTDDLVFDRSGDLPRQLRANRLPEALTSCEADIDIDVPLRPQGDNPLFLRLLQEDGTRAWTSPVYVFRELSLTR